MNKKITIGIISLVGIMAFMFSGRAQDLATLGATILYPVGGGTGTSTAPSYGQLLVGNSSGTYSLTSTSTLGLVNNPMTANLDAGGYNISNVGTLTTSYITISQNVRSPFNIGDGNGNATTTITVSANGDATFKSTTTNPILTLKNNGYVGIGTTSPGTILYVDQTQNAGSGLTLNNDSSGTGAAAGIFASNDKGSMYMSAIGSGYTTSLLTIANSGQIRSSQALTGGMAITTGTSAPIIFGISDAEQMRITSGGLIGIGTTVPYQKLELLGGDIGIENGNSNTNGAIGKGLEWSNIYYQDSRVPIAAIYSPNNPTYVHGGGNISFSTAPNQASPSLVERMRIINTGYVGIGTTSPSVLLHTYNASGNNEIKVDSGSASGVTSIGLANKSDDYAIFSFDNSTNNAYLYQNYVVSGYLGLGAATRKTDLIIASNARVGISSTTPTALLTVNAPAGTDSFAIGSTTADVFRIDKDYNFTFKKDAMLRFGNNAGTGYVNFVNKNTSDEFEMNGTLNVGTLEFPEDSGVIAAMNLPISSAQTAGTVDSYTFRIDNNNLLTAYGEANGSGGAQNLKVGVATTTPFGLLSINPSGITGPSFVIGSSTATSFIVDNGGNVGIGTINSSNAKLNIYSSRNSLYVQGGDGGAGTTIANFVDYSSVSQMIIRGNGYVGIGSTTPYGLLSINPTSIIGTAPQFVIGSSTATSFIVTNTGNVGIGLTNPESLLQIHSASPTFELSDSDYASLQVRSTINANAGTLIFSSDPGSNVNNNYISFRTDLTEKVRIDEGGNVGIGTTTPYGLLGIEQGTETNSLWIGNTGSSTPSLVVRGVNGNGKIGIGTNSPAAKLHITGDVIVNLNTTEPTGNLTGTAISARGADNSLVRIAYSSYGTAGMGGFAGRHARGTAGSLAAVQVTDTLVGLEGWGYGDTGYSNTPRVMIRGHAASTWTDTNQDTYLAFWTTPSATIVPLERMRILPNGNVGVGTTTPFALFANQGTSGGTQALAIFASSTTSNNFTIEKDGTFILNGDATTWEDLRFPATAINPAGAATPMVFDITNLGFTSSAAGTTTIAVIAQMPHSWKQGSTIHPHIHWEPTTTNTGNVVYNIEYKWSNINDVESGTWTYIQAVQAGAGTAFTHQLLELPDITATGKTFSSILSIKVSRGGDSTLDTYTGDSLLKEFDIHFEQDSLGSREELAK